MQCEGPGPKGRKPTPGPGSSKFGAGNGTRTRDVQLGRLELYQLSYSRPLRHPAADSRPRPAGRLPARGDPARRGRAQRARSSKWWRGEDSNLRSLMATDLQSVPFDRSGTPPRWTHRHARSLGFLLAPTPRGTTHSADTGPWARGTRGESFTLGSITRFVRTTPAKDACHEKVYSRASWSWRWDLNPQPADYKSAALPLSYASANA